METLIAHNDFYSITVNHTQQRLYIKVSGLWNSARLVPNYCQDISTAVSLLQETFTCLADFSAMRPFSQEVADHVHIPALRRLMRSNLCRSAQIMPDNHQTIDLLEKMGEKMHVRLNMFDSHEMATMYLDYVRA